MDRDEALRLLGGGEEGIRTWNEYRKRGGEVPDLDGADLTGMDLRGAFLSGVRLRDVNLRGADLRGADLSGLGLYDAKLSWRVSALGAELAGANLRGADLRGADLSRAGSLAQSQLDEVRGDALTRLPPGLVLGPYQEEVQRRPGGGAKAPLAMRARERKAK